MAMPSIILAWRIPWTEKPGGLHSPWGHKESDTTDSQLTEHAGKDELHFRQKTSSFMNQLFKKINLLIVIGG